MGKRNRRDKQKLQIKGHTIQPLYFLTFDLLLLFISSVSWGHCIVWPSICTFCLSCRYLMAIVLSDLQFVVSVYLVGIVWPLYCLTFDLLLLFILSWSVGHCIAWPPICSFRVSCRYLLAKTEATNRRSDNTMAKRYRQDKQKLQIEGQTIQWP
jgi:hypothetical protein